MARKPYRERSDLEKLQSQWHKLSGLGSRKEWSAAVVRAATAAEIAANFAVRTEFAKRSTFDDDFVNSLLRWANGLNGKVKNLLMPLCAADKDKQRLMKRLLKLSAEINAVRNAVAHQGEFCNETEAEGVLAAAQSFINDLVQLYEPKFALKKPERKSQGLVSDTP